MVQFSGEFPSLPPERNWIVVTIQLILSRRVRDKIRGKDTCCVTGIITARGSGRGPAPFYSGESREGFLLINRSILPPMSQIAADKTESAEIRVICG